MTISTTDSIAGPFSGNDVATAFPFTNFKVLQNSHLIVIYTDAVGAETTLTEGVDYSLVLNADQEVSPGGTITYPIAGSPLATGEKLTGQRSVPQTQGTDLGNQTKYDATVVETSLDKVVMNIQELQEEVDRSVKVSVSSGDDPDALVSSIATSESNAAASASAAAVSETNAASSETNAAVSEAKANQWAEEAEDVEVDPGEYSAHHWANKAAAIVSPPDISGYVKGETNYVESEGSSSISFSVPSVIVASTWESVGPTGSAADNTWTALDSLPVGTTYVDLKLHIGVTGSTLANNYSTQLFGRPTGSARVRDSTTQIGEASLTNQSGSNERDSNFTMVRLPVDSSGRFDLSYLLYGATAAPTILLHLVSFGV